MWTLSSHCLRSSCVVAIVYSGLQTWLQPEGDGMNVGVGEKRCLPLGRSLSPKDSVKEDLDEFFHLANDPAYADAAIHQVDGFTSTDPHKADAILILEGIVQGFFGGVQNLINALKQFLDDTFNAQVQQLAFDVSRRGELETLRLSDKTVIDENLTVWRQSVDCRANFGEPTANIFVKLIRQRA
jgi:hypothetical protein